MLKDQMYQPTVQEARRYAASPTIITSTSPRNIIIQNSYPVGTSANYVYTPQSNSINPESNNAKPVSVPVYTSIQSPKNISFNNSSVGINMGQSFGAIEQKNSIEMGTALPQIRQVTTVTQNYQRFSSGGKVVPTRPNFHFFGSDSRQEVSRSNSPPVQVRNQNENSQSHSYSPLSIRSNNSSQANKDTYRVRFSYNNGAIPINIQTAHGQAGSIQTGSIQTGGLQTTTIQTANIQTANTHTSNAQTTQNQVITTHQPAYIRTVFANTQPVQNQIYPPPLNHDRFSYSFSQALQPQTYIQTQHIPNNQPVPVPVSIPQPQPHMQIPQPHPQHPPQAYSIVQAHQQPMQPMQPMQPQWQNQVVHVNSTVVHTTTIVWEHRFVEIYTKFQIFVQRFQTIIQEIYGIDDMFDNVNDEEAWNDLRLRYTDLIENFNIMREEIIMVLEQNKAAINSLSPEVVKEINQKNMQTEQQKGQEQGHQGQEIQQGYPGHIQEGDQTGKSGSEQNHIWQNRCLELMQQHQILTKQNNELKQQLQYMKNQQSAGEGAKEGETQYPKVAQLQKNLNLMHAQYQKLEDNYNRISIEYSRALSQLQNRATSKSSEGGNQQVAEMQQQLEMAQAKINQLYEQLQQKSEHVEHYEKQIANYSQILEQNKKLMETLNKNYHDLDSYENQIKNRDQAIHEYNSEINRLNQRIAQLNRNPAQAEQSNSSVHRSSQLNAKNLQIQSLRQHEKSLLTMIEKHEQTIQQMYRKHEILRVESEAAIRSQQNQMKMLQRFLQEERQSKKKLLNQSYDSETKPTQNITQSKAFLERVQIQVTEAVSEKNRKIKYMAQDIEELKYQLQNLEKEKQKEIKQIKQFFTEEEQKYTKKIIEKQANIRILQQKTKSFESQLSNKNLQISRFRHQSPVNSFGNGQSQQSRRHNEVLDKKNLEIQQLKRLLQQKLINIKELEQKSSSLEQQVHAKIFEINSLRREVNDQHGSRAEIDNLNSVIKKKNQEINELRLSSIELDQLRMNNQSLEREKIRLNEYLKEKTRESQSKDSTIQSLERKVHSISASLESYGISKKVSTDGPSPSVVTNYQNLLKQRQSQIKTLKYEIQMLQTKVSISEKSIRDLNTKVGNYQKSSSVLKADMQNKASRYEADIKALNKQLKSLKQNKQQLKNIVESLRGKNAILEKTLDQRNSLFDKQILKGKEKASSFEQINGNLLTEQQIQKTQMDRLTKQNSRLNQKIKVLQNKVNQRNNTISDLKANVDKKQREQNKVYEDKIKKLEGELKLNQVKIKNMEQEITNLNKKIQHAESQKRSYRDRLISEHNTPNKHKQEFYEINRAVSSDFDLGNVEILEMEKFRLKDPQANDVFERKVIYELKKQNDFLRRELSNAGPSTYSVNRLDQLHRLSSYQQQIYTDRQNQSSKQQEHSSEVLTFYKNKNKELQNRIDELLKVNNELKSKLSSMNPNSSSQMSIQFYKEQSSKLQEQINSLQGKMKKLLAEQKSVMDQASGREHEIESLKQKVGQLSLKINEQKNIIKNYQDKIAELENVKAISYSEIQRLKETIQRFKVQREQSNKKDKLIGQSNRKCKNLEEEVSKLTNKINILSAQIDRLNGVIKNKTNEQDNKFKQTNEQSQKLKRRILQLQRQLQLIKSQHQSTTTTQTPYKLQKLRSYITSIDTLLSEIPLQGRRAEQVIKQIRQQIEETFSVIGMIQI